MLIFEPLGLGLGLELGLGLGLGLGVGVVIGAVMLVPEGLRPGGVQKSLYIAEHRIPYKIIQYNFKVFSAGRDTGEVKISPFMTGVPEAICCLTLWYQHH